MTDSKILEDSDKRKPPSAGKGRPKGAINKLTATIKNAIEASFEKVGGAEYLARMAETQPVAYMTLLGKVLPTQIDGSVQAIGMAVVTIARASDAD